MYLKNKGFTLIELLVVISIISLLSSIVLTTLSNARGKAKDAAIITGVEQLVKLMNLEFYESESYCNLQRSNIEGSGWAFFVGRVFSCDSMLTSSIIKGNYANQAVAICKNIYENSPDKTGWGGNPGDFRIYWGTDEPKNDGGCKDTYSFGVHLNNDKWYCSGSSGNKGERDNINPGQLGCHEDP